MKLEFFRQIFEKNLQILNFMNIVQLEPRYSMRTDRRADMTKLIVAFRNLRTRLEKTNAVRIDSEIHFVCMTF